MGQVTRALAGFALLLAGCTSTARCKPGTLFLSLSFSGSAASATSIDVTVSVDNMGSMLTTLPVRAGSPDGTIEIDFAPGYPAGHMADVLVVARAGGAIVGEGSASVMLDAGCSASTLTVSAGAIDLGVTDGASDAAADGASDLGPDLAGVEMAPCGGVIYVSQTTGNDSFSGCDPKFPTQTISVALASAGLHGVTRIDVCKGTYSENVSTSIASIYGGYDCATWTRASDYGYPTFNPVHATVLSPSAPTNTLTVNGNVIIDGLTINGQPAGVTTQSTASAVIVLNSSPTISNCSIHGGAGTTISGTGSRGVYYGVSGTGTPVVGGTLQNNFIEGGSGAGSSIGSTGVELNADGASTHIIGNTIQGGSGTSVNCVVGSVGLHLTRNGTLSQATHNAVEQNVITGGRGTVCTGSGSTCTSACPGGTDASRGTYISESSTNQNVTLEFIGNSIEGVGGGMASTSSGGPIGFHLSGRGTSQTPPTSMTVRLLQNRIYGGLDGAAGAGATGASVANVYSVQIDDNMIHGGDATNAGGATIALFIANITQPPALIRHNTLIGGPTTSSTQGAALWLQANSNGQSPGGAVVENNILGGFGDVGITFDSCPTTTGILQSLRNNVFINDVTDLIYYSNTGACPPSGNSNAGSMTIDAMNAALTGCTSSTDASTCTNATVSGNVVLRLSCGGETGCIANAACPPLASFTAAQLTGCFQALFGANWDAATNGYATLFAPGPGWKLTSPISCAIAQSSLDLTTATPPVTSDLYNTMRVPPPSMGAYESTAAQKAACQ